MQLAEVVGTVVASVKSEGLEGVRFLIVQPLDRYRKPQGRPVVAAGGNDKDQGDEQGCRGTTHDSSSR